MLSMIVHSTHNVKDAKELGDVPVMNFFTPACEERWSVGCRAIASVQLVLPHPLQKIVRALRCGEDPHDLGRIPPILRANQCLDELMAAACAWGQ